MDHRTGARICYLALFFVCVSNAATAEGWFGLNAVEVETSGFFLNPLVDSLTFREVAPGSPAAEQSIRPGDIVLTIDGRIVRGSKARQLHALLDKTIGSKLALQLIRPDGTEYAVVLTAVRKPAIPGRSE